MILVFQKLKTIFPELNRAAISPKRIFEVFEKMKVVYVELPLERNGYYISDTKKDYVFLKSAMSQMLFHEVLAHETAHAFTSTPAARFLLWRFEIEAEALSLIMMMPLADLARLNRIKNQLDDESYDLLMRRNKIKSLWGL